MQSQFSVLYLPEWYPTAENPLNGIFTRDLAELLATRNTVDCVVVLFSKSAVGRSCTERKLPSGLREIQITLPWQKFGFIRIWKQYLEIAAWMRSEKKVGNNYHILHAQIAWKTGFIAWLLHIKFALPFIITEHYTGYMDLDGSLQGFRLLGSLFSLKRANKVVVVSEGLQKTLLEKEISNVEVIPNIVHKVFMESELVPQRPDGANSSFVHISNFDERQKQTSVIIKIFVELRKKYSDITLTLVTSKSAFELYRQKNNNLDLHGISVVEAGISKEEIFSIFQKSTALISYSKYETFGLTIAEAICSGLPVIYTSCGGPEYYVETNMGTMVDADVPETLFLAMEEVIQKKSFNASTIATNARSKFMPGNILSKYELLYLSMQKK